MQTGIATNPPILYAPPGLTTPGQTNVNFVPVLNSQPSTNKIDRFPKRAGRLLGSIQLTCGILCIIFQSAAIAVESELAFIAHGIWCGCFFVLAGSFGIAAASAKTKCLIVAFLVLSILSATLTPIVLVISAIGWAEDAEECSRGYWDYDGNYICRRADDVVIAMNAMLVFTAVVEGVTAILSAITCCRAYCCCRDKTSNSKQQFIVVYVGNGAGGNPAVINTQTMRLQQPTTQGLTQVNPNLYANHAGAPPEYQPPSTDEYHKERM